MPRPLRLCTLVLLLFVPLSARAISAQVVRGVVTTRGDGSPVAGALIQLVGLHGEAGPAVLTDGSGGFVLEAYAPGSYRLRVQRIGYADALSDTLHLVVSQVRQYPLQISSKAVTLEGITAKGRSRGCSIRENGETVARVWGEARKALGALKLTQASGRVHFDTETFRREMDPNTGAVRTQTTHPLFGRTGNPFRSQPVETLSKYGYVRMFPDSVVYYGPDARVLLSDRFLDDHCFRLARGEGDDAALIGLAFSPARNDFKPDIQGTMWLDRKTSELRSVEYHYVRMPVDVATDDFGGRIEFERLLPSGAWIVRRWVIRMPVVGIENIHWQGATKMTTRLIAIVEAGGRVVAVHDSPAARR